MTNIITPIDVKCEKSYIYVSKKVPLPNVRQMQLSWSKTIISWSKRKALFYIDFIDMRKNMLLTTNL